MFNLFIARYREPFIVWFAILIHLLWSVNMFIEPMSGFATAPYAVKMAFGDTAPFLLPIGCMLAFIGMVIPRRIVSVLLMLPQAWFLFISAVSAVRSVYLGQFPDGVERSRLFILNDQAWAAFLAMLYIYAIVQIARTKE